MPGLALTEMAEPEICCGFGGTFCVKYPDISVRMVSDKTADIAATGADLLLAGDMGCLLNMAGRLKREGPDPGAPCGGGAGGHEFDAAGHRRGRGTIDQPDEAR